MNRLERIGWAIAAQEMLTIRPSSALMLRALVVDFPGRVVSCDHLASLTNREGDFTPATRRASARLASARRALVDLGFPENCIMCVLGAGYQVSARVAQAIDALIQTGEVPDSLDIAA